MQLFRDRHSGARALACAIAFVIATVAAGCDAADVTDPITTKTMGAIMVTVYMTGVELPTGYSVRAVSQTVFADRNAAAVLKQVTPGTHQVQLQLPPNCQATENPRSVTVVAGQTATVSFSVTCEPTSGFVRVSAPTTGTDPDPDGYAVLLTGVNQTGGRYNRIERVTGSEAVLLSVPVGSATLMLQGVSTNCLATASSIRTVTVRLADTTSVEFPVECSRRTQLAYVGATGNGDIYVAYEDGTDVRRLTSEPSVEADPAWSPDGGKLAFSSNRDGDGDADIYTMNPDGSGVTRVTTERGADYQPAWSPDGRKIAFTSTRTGDAEIFVMNADGTNPVRLTNSLGDDSEPAWSPDGQNIAFTTRRGDKPQIYFMNADGSGNARLLFDAAQHPAWSPDGSQIAFSGVYCSTYYYYSLGCFPAVFVAAGAQISTVFLGARPSWSPDGRKIASNGFDCDFDFGGGCTEGPFRITRIADGQVVTLGTGSAPAWRPR